jgi:hypothetical protein
MIRLLEDLDPEIRMEAAYSLSSLGAAALRAVPRLRGPLDDFHMEVREAARVAVDQIERRSGLSA